MTKPTVGRIVHFYQGDFEAAQVAGVDFSRSDRADDEQHLRDFGSTYHGTNGRRFHAALIIQVWSDTRVNLMVFFGDGSMEARLGYDLMPWAMFDDGAHYQNGGWCWPPAPGHPGVAR